MKQYIIIALFWTVAAFDRFRLKNGEGQYLKWFASKTDPSIMGFTTHKGFGTDQAILKFENGVLSLSHNGVFIPGYMQGNNKNDDRQLLFKKDATASSDFSIEEVNQISYLAYNESLCWEDFSGFIYYSSKATFEDTIYGSPFYTTLAVEYV